MYNSVKNCISKKKKNYGTSLVTQIRASILIQGHLAMTFIDAFMTRHTVYVILLIILFLRPMLI